MKNAAQRQRHEPQNETGRQRGEIEKADDLRDRAKRAYQQEIAQRDHAVAKPAKIGIGQDHHAASQRKKQEEERERIEVLDGRHKTDGYDLVEWVAGQPWCSGKVGMMGISWGGFNALQVAAKQPPAPR